MPNNLSEAYEAFRKAYLKLTEFIQTDNKTEKDRAAIIHAFEYTFELWWKFLQRYLESVGTVEEYGPRATIQNAFSYRLLDDNGNRHMDMLRDRNLTAHTYNEDTAKEIYTRIVSEHIFTLKAFVEKFDEKIG